MSDVRLHAGLDGDTGTVRLEARVHARLPVTGATWTVGRADGPVEFTPSADGSVLHARMLVADPPRWWPHTHGDQPLVPCSLCIEAGGQTRSFDLGSVGFRSVEIEVGRRIWAAGQRRAGVLPWGVLDRQRPGRLRRVARAPSAATWSWPALPAANMLRVGGTMAYESDAFYQLCDELGLLVWQDFMFANMDYPVDDPAFAANVEAEAVCQLGRLSAHPSVAVYCGNSEVEQQAAMLGLPRETWTNPWFSRGCPSCAPATIPARLTSPRPRPAGPYPSTSAPAYRTTTASGPTAGRSRTSAGRT